MPKCTRLFLCIPLIICSLVTTNLLAQGGETALLRVVVNDPTGAVLGKARVTMTNEGTGVATTLETDERGLCIFKALQPAPYSAQVEARGFKTVERQHIVLQVGQQAEIAILMQIGTQGETVLVSGDAPLVNVVSAELGTTVSGNYILDMPLFDRNPTALVFLAPGVTNVNGGNVNALGGLNFSSNGQRTFTAEFRLDGAVASVPEGGEGQQRYLQALGGGHSGIQAHE